MVVRKVINIESQRDKLFTGVVIVAFTSDRSKQRSASSSSQFMRVRFLQ